MKYAFYEGNSLTKLYFKAAFIIVKALVEF